MGDSLAGEVADRLRGPSGGTQPTILMGAGAFGGNNEYLLVVGDDSDLVIANGGLGSVGEVMRRGCKSSPPTSASAFSSVIGGSAVDVLAFRLLPADVVRLSTALFRRASREEDREAAGMFAIITVYRSRGLCEISTSSFGKEDIRVGRSASVRGGPVISADDGGVGSNNILFPAQGAELSCENRASGGTGGGSRVGGSGICAFAMLSDFFHT